ncbi:hypothetical membrane protein [Thermococcus kodakarensis KOD1]|uniref:Hypothetical membrane protein n=1 Tax=Thermococcus kodakarensis (strain ATCC BAA-918 / JCM 12380 / KOD1) TaxID=69014 RepID=Q5JEL2_THEKO|nr:prenyltransferase/squalene oxidase repeat-containing protein [Thermococcus kodakarensis]WCN27745.1 terpene cyclase/mutase family protein [Thermococcus kodakarensis]WCN30038.1 terpene cyclase/mutase family protein [Thermococcus kodakarensis]BAD86027.1 hypothetical membrane protein [Thermococcus kodakarensis KOD1]
MACLKVIALARSGYPRNSSEFLELVEWIKSRQRGDGSFPAVITDDYPESDSEWFYWELSKAAGTGLAILALLEAGENPNSKEIEEAAQFLLKNESKNYWTSTVYLYWEKTGLHKVNESPSIVATAYAVAALSRLGYNVSREWKWLRERLTRERLITPYLDNFFTGFLFPMPYRDMRAPYESIVLPLLFLREENMTLPNETLEFIASLFEETQYAGNATLRLSFKRVTNYTVKELEYSINGCEVREEWKGSGEKASIDLNPGPSKNSRVFLIISGEPLLLNESGFFKGNQRLYPHLPEDYIEFVGDFYAERSVLQFEDGRNYAIIEVPALDGSWNHDVYSTAMALMWLYLAGKKDNHTEEVLRFLELASSKNTMAFDGSAYALISLSLYSGEWENEQATVEKEQSSQHQLPLKLLAVFILGLLIGALVGVKIGMTKKKRS